ncbi:MAG: helix-turn-helix domain-containing protein [Pseudomonadota bacterium]
MRDGANRRMTRRDLRREATKAAVIEAARSVFLERGYERATIKAIAEAGRVSAGTVLNAAPSKAALLVEILKEEYAAIGDASARLASALSGRLSDRLSALMQISLEAQARHPELFAAAIGHAWLVSDPSYEESAQQMELAWAPIRSAVDEAVTAGELRSGLDVDQVTDALQDLYLGVLRRHRRGGLDAASASAMLSQRVHLLFDGLKRD